MQFGPEFGEQLLVAALSGNDLNLFFDDPYLASQPFLWLAGEPQYIMPLDSADSPQDEISRESAAGSDDVKPEAEVKQDGEVNPEVQMTLDAEALSWPNTEGLFDDFETRLREAEQEINRIDEIFPVKEEDTPHQSSAEKSTALDVDSFFAENITIPVTKFTPAIEPAPLVLSVTSGTKRDEDQATNCEKKSEPSKAPQPIATAFKESKRRKDHTLLEITPQDSKFMPLAGNRQCKVKAQEKISNIFKRKQ